MSDRETNPGLRERKKLQTRGAIRREAIRLITERGYAATTVEDIAAAAQVSTSTFFRYFPNKSAVLVPGQMMEPIIAAFLAAPAEMTPIRAYRHAVEQVFSHIAGPEWAEELTRQALMYTLPEAAGPLYTQYIDTLEQIAAAMAIRLNRPATDPAIRTTAGAMVGVMMEELHGRPMDPDRVYRALEFLDAGLPLT